MEKAIFSLANYHFDKVLMDLSELNPDTSLSVNFEPTGVFDSTNSMYTLSFVFTATNNTTKNQVISVNCIAQYIFKNVSSLPEIPDFFYNNAIAILFPYVRAFVSTVTLQANIRPILLPTLNLSDLQATLKNNTHGR